MEDKNIGYYTVNRSTNKVEYHRTLTAYSYTSNTIPLIEELDEVFKLNIDVYEEIHVGKELYRGVLSRYDFVEGVLKGIPIVEDRTLEDNMLVIIMKPNDHLEINKLF